MSKNTEEKLYECEAVKHFMFDGDIVKPKGKIKLNARNVNIYLKRKQILVPKGFELKKT